MKQKSNIKRFSAFLFIVFIIYIFSLFVKVPFNLYTQILFGFIIISIISITLKLSIDTIKNPLSKFEYKNYTVPILCFLISGLISVPSQILIVSNNFNEHHCLPMILLHLLWFISFSNIACNTYIKFKSKNKTETAIIMLILLLLILLSLVRAILILFGVFWAENCNFILLK